MKYSKDAVSELLNDTNFTFSNHFCYRKLLGSGGFGHVVLAVSKATLEAMAVKVSRAPRHR